MTYLKVKRYGIAALLVALLFTLISLYSAVVLAYADGESTDEPAVEIISELNVHFLDVGQADSCIIELPDGKNMLIDAGENKTESKKTIIDYVEKNIKGTDGKTIEYFDYVILTHPDSDHCGGMAAVLKEYPAKVFYRPNVYADREGDFTDPELSIKELGKNNIKDTAAYYNAIRAGYNPDKINDVETVGHVFDPFNDDISLIKPDSLKETDPNYYTFTFYAPLGKTYKDWNDYSPVMILDYHGKRFMLSGDAEKECEKGFVEKAATKEGKYSIFDDDFTVNVFKLGHHGSRTSSSEAFIDVMTTKSSRKDVLAIISCGAGNSYGHPHKDVLDRLESMGFSDENILRTDKMGTITVSVRGEIAEGSETAAYNLYVNNVVHVDKDAPGLTRKQIYIIIAVVVIIVLVVIIVGTMRAKKAPQASTRSAHSGAHSSGGAHRTQNKGRKR